MENYTELKEDIQELKGDVKSVLRILNGNGNVGLCTKVALNKESIKRAWWWLSAISLAILGMACFVIRSVC